MVLLLVRLDVRDVAVTAGTRGAVLDARDDVPTHVEVHRVTCCAVEPVGALGQLRAQGVALLAGLQGSFKGFVRGARVWRKLSGF